MTEQTCGTLFVTGTPIGNLSDFSPRAIEALESADFIAAEDTRVTLKLLNHFDIKTPMVSYHEHNRNQKGPELLARILNGEDCALVTDAGMPAISDPGQDLVDLCLEHGVPVHAVPGPTAFATALALRVPEDPALYPHPLRGAPQTVRHAEGSAGDPRRPETLHLPGDHQGP